MKTRVDLIYRALRNLGVLPQGQTPSDEEYDSVDALIDSMIDELNQRDIVYVPNAEQIPEEWFQPLGRILAWACASEFGAASDAALASLAQKSEMDLQKMNAMHPTYAVLKAEFF